MNTVLIIALWALAVFYFWEDSDSIAGALWMITIVTVVCWAVLGEPGL